MKSLSDTQAPSVGLPGSLELSPIHLCATAMETDSYQQGGGNEGKRSNQSSRYSLSTTYMHTPWTNRHWRNDNHALVEIWRWVYIPYRMMWRTSQDFEWRTAKEQQMRTWNAHAKPSYLESARACTCTKFNLQIWHKGKKMSYLVLIWTTCISLWYICARWQNSLHNHFTKQHSSLTCHICSHIRKQEKFMFSKFAETCEFLLWFKRLFSSTLETSTQKAWWKGLDELN